MRGSGKTSELAKYSKLLDTPRCFFCVTCNIDTDLDLNELEYMDILILQLEQLSIRLSKFGFSVDEGILRRMQDWFAEREKEITNKLDSEIGFEIGAEVNTKTPFFSLVSLSGKFKTGVTGTNERANIVRQSLKNNFIPFASIFNEFIEEVNLSLRHNNVAQEVLFIVDGLEKTMSADTHRKIIIEEQNRISKIKAYTIFTLPIELIKFRQKLMQFSSVEAFPFVKILERNGDKNEAAFRKLREFVYKRIDQSLFDTQEVVDKAISYSGGSPRELLRILELSAFNVDDEKATISMPNLDKALNRITNQTAQYLTKPILEKIKEIVEKNQRGESIEFDETLEHMLENTYVMEYNDGSYKRINPVIELSNLYKQYVQ
jgi:hypothetical protein